MLSLTPLFDEAGYPDHAQSCADVGYFLRRAEEESIAAIRAPDPRAASSHSGLATLYSSKSIELIQSLSDEPLRASAA